MRRIIPLLLLLLLAGCGYHLVGQGQHGVLTGSRTVALVTYSVSPRDAAVFKARLEQAGYEVRDKSERDVDAVLLLRQDTVRYAPSAYDKAGIATQYRMTIRGHLTVEKDHKAVWDSGTVTSSGDIFVAGGPASIEASRARLEEDLQRQCLRDIWARLQSGF